MNDRARDPVDVEKAWVDDLEIDPGQYWNVICRAKWRILSLALLMSLASALWVFKATPIYKASATVMIEAVTPKMLSVEEVYSPDNRGEEYYHTQLKILDSPIIAERVIEQLQLAYYPEYGPPPASPLKQLLAAGLPATISEALFNRHGSASVSKPKQHQHRLATYLDNLDISPVEKTQLVEVAFESEDPVLASEIANAHAGAYIASILETRMSISHSALTRMSERLETLKTTLEESERNLQTFREREQVIDAEGLQSLTTKELHELTTVLVEARRSLSQARSAYRQVGRLPSKNSESLESIPAVLEDKLVQEFKKLKAHAANKVGELSKTYGPRHPIMIAARSELQTANENLHRQMSTIVQGIKKSYEVARAHEASLVAAIAKAKEEYHAMGRKESELLSLQREVQSNRELYDMFYSRIKETAQTRDLGDANVRVISPAAVPIEPVRPDKRLTIGVAFAGSIVMGILLVFLSDAFNNNSSLANDVDRLIRRHNLKYLSDVDGFSREHNPKYLNEGGKSPQTQKLKYF